MSAGSRWRKQWKYGAGALGLAVVGFGAGQRLGSQRLQAAPPAALASLPGDPLFAGKADAATLRTDQESIIQAQRKRIMGRLRSLEQVRRVATVIRPHLDRAIEMPSIQADLRALAASAGMSLADFKEYFKGKEEADLL
ncbi:MAG TPA: hypothetical protein VFU47_09365, partial [Armatimonadota bacterium]|nr:hypothetical protein [Armatimonadota bacterium]